MGNLRIPDSETSLAKKSIRYRGALSWNSLPNHLKTNMGEAWKFKKQLKTWVKENIEI